MADADARAVTRALGGRWHGGALGGYGTARCPAHEDRHLSLSLSLRDGRTGRLLLRCHAGCECRDIENAMRGLGLAPVLFPPVLFPCMALTRRLGAALRGARPLGARSDEPSCARPPHPPAGRTLPPERGGVAGPDTLSRQDGRWSSADRR